MAITNLLRTPAHLPDDATSPGFSLTPDLIRTILQHARPLGHYETSDEPPTVSSSN